MPDLRISELPALQSSGISAEDDVAVADLSASMTKKVNAKGLVQQGVSTLIDDGVIPGSKLVSESVGSEQIMPDAIGSSELADGSVDTAALQDQAVTSAKVAPDLDGALLKANSVSATSFDPDGFNRGINRSGGKVGHTNNVISGLRNGISFDAHGHITETAPLLPSDLPIAKQSTIGGVLVPYDGGLEVSSIGAISHQNNVEATTERGIEYDDHGHIVEINPLSSEDLPIAADTKVGAVSVPTGYDLTLDGEGELTHSTSTSGAGTFTKVQVNEFGHVVGSELLQATDIPALNADILTTGFLNPARIEKNAIQKEKLADYATIIIQEADPGLGDYVGQGWYRESDAQLRIWSGNSFIPVGFGRLSNENLRWCGTFDASTGLVDVVTPIGNTAGFKAGQAVPVASDVLSGAYLVCAEAGTFNDKTFDAGDWLLCVNEAEGYIRIDTLSSGGGGGRATKIEDLLDVNVTSPKSGDTLIFDASTATWYNVSVNARKADFIEQIDGVRTEFTLSIDAVSANDLLISLGGVIQEPGVAFDFTAPRTINFSEPPPFEIPYFVLVESIPLTADESSPGQALPTGTAADEYLQWNNNLKKWVPSTVIQGGTF